MEDGGSESELGFVKRRLLGPGVPVTQSQQEVNESKQKSTVVSYSQLELNVLGIKDFGSRKG